MQTGKIPPPYRVPGVTLGRCPLQHPRDQDVSLDTVAFNWFHSKLHCNHRGVGEIHLHLAIGATYFKIQKIPKIVAHVHVQLFSRQ